MDLSKGFLKTVKDHDTRLKALESTNQIQKIITDGKTIIDASGLNSLGNFTTSQSFNGASALSTTSTSFVDVSGSSLSTFTTTRDTNILFWLMGYGRNDDNITSDGTSYVEVQLYDNAISGGVANIFMSGSNSTNVVVVGSTVNYHLVTKNIMISRSALLTMSAGTHDLKLQYRAVNGGTAHLDGWLIGYLLLGS